MFKLIKKLMLFVVCLLAFQACGQQSQKTDAEPKAESETISKMVSPDEFRELITSGDGILLDVRTPEEFNAGHIEGAININFNANDFYEQVNQLPKDTTIYLYCRTQNRSGNAMKQMTQDGYGKIYTMQGGILAWEKEGNEVVR